MTLADLAELVESWQKKYPGKTPVILKDGTTTRLLYCGEVESNTTSIPAFAGRRLYLRAARTYQEWEDSI